jgi:hypothetical protein
MAASPIQVFAIFLLQNWCLSSSLNVAQTRFDMTLPSRKMLRHLDDMLACSDCESGGCRKFPFWSIQDGLKS